MTQTNGRATGVYTPYVVRPLLQMGRLGVLPKGV